MTKALQHGQTALNYWDISRQDRKISTHAHFAFKGGIDDRLVPYDYFIFCLSEVRAMPVAFIHRVCPPDLRPVFDELADGSYQRKEIFQSEGGLPLSRPTHTAMRCYEGQLVLGKQAWESLQAFHANVFHRAFRYSRRGKSPELVILQEPVVTRSQQIGTAAAYWGM